MRQDRWPAARIVHLGHVPEERDGEQGGCDDEAEAAGSMMWPVTIRVFAPLAER